MHVLAELVVHSYPYKADIHMTLQVGTTQHNTARHSTPQQSLADVVSTQLNTALPHMHYIFHSNRLRCVHMCDNICLYLHFDNPISCSQEKPDAMCWLFGVLCKQELMRDQPMPCLTALQQLQLKQLQDQQIALVEAHQAQQQAAAATAILAAQQQAAEQLQILSQQRGQLAAGVVPAAGSYSGMMLF
jgi:hypothetical protein